MLHKTSSISFVLLFLYSKIPRIFETRKKWARPQQTLVTHTIIVGASAYRPKNCRKWVTADIVAFLCLLVRFLSIFYKQLLIIHDLVGLPSIIAMFTQFTLWQQLEDSATINSNKLHSLNWPQQFLTSLRNYVPWLLYRFEFWWFKFTDWFDVHNVFKPSPFKYCSSFFVVACFYCNEIQNSLLWPVSERKLNVCTNTHKLTTVAKHLTYIWENQCRCLTAKNVTSKNGKSQWSIVYYMYWFSTNI